MPSQSLHSSRRDRQRTTIAILLPKAKAAAELRLLKQRTGYTTYAIFDYIYFEYIKTNILYHINYKEYTKKKDSNQLMANHLKMDVVPNMELLLKTSNVSAMTNSRNTESYVPTFQKLFINWRLAKQFLVYLVLVSFLDT